MKMEDNILKEYIKEADYEKCIELLKEKIIVEVEKYIKKINKNYKRTTIFDLMEACEKYLKTDDIKILYRIINSDLEDSIRVSLLIELYQNLIKAQVK